MNELATSLNLNIGTFELTTPQNLVTLIFSIIILGTAIPKLFKSLTTFEANGIPNYLISLGILGTFTGIFLGLLNFDEKNIQQSVPSLIEGMKLAFISSILGMFFAILIKRKYINDNTNKIKNDTLTEQETLSIENALKSIIEIRASLIGKEESLLNQIKQLKKEFTENLIKLGKAISGDDDSSLVTQLKLLRSESRDELSKLNTSVDKFYEEIAGKSTDVLLDALKELISEFNKNLNEQFGENFKELNEAIGKILAWQTKYKEQLDAMIITQNQTAQDMATASSSFNILVNKADVFNNISAKFNKIMNGLNSLLQALEEQRNDISNHLKTFADISEKANSGLPNIEKKINELSHQLFSSIENLNEKNNAYLESAISQGEILNKQMLDTMTKGNEELNEHIKQAVERTNEQVIKLDQAMSEELTKALESFGKQLTSLSQKFVSDYQPLTEELKKVVEISKGIK